MKTDRTLKSDRLFEVMKERGLDIPPQKFSERLVEIAARSYRRNYAVVYRKEERLGRVILVVLILLNLWVLYLLFPLSINPLPAAGIVALAIGLGVLISLHKLKAGRRLPI